MDDDGDDVDDGGKCICYPLVNCSNPLLLLLVYVSGALLSSIL